MAVQTTGIANKSTGQPLTATEFNTVKNVIDNNAAELTATNGVVATKVTQDGSKVLSDNNFTTAEKTKLGGVATGATANDTDANLKNRANHTGTQSADTITDGSTNRVYTTSEKTNVATIPTLTTTVATAQATANTAAAAARQRRGTYANKSAVDFGSRLPHSSNLSDGTETTQTSRINHQTIGAISDLQILFTNFPPVQEASTTLAYNDITIEASIEYPVNVFTRVTFNGGNDTYLLKKDRQVLSDYINLEIPAGVTYWIRTNVLVTAGQKWLKTHASATSVSGGSGALSGSNLVMSGTITDNEVFTYTASLVLGVSQTSKASIFLFGDSNASGTGDDVSFVPQGTKMGFQFYYGNGGGLYGRAFKNNFPVIRASLAGQRIEMWAPTGIQSKYYGAIISAGQFAVSNLGTNDFPTRSAAQMKFDYISMWGSQKSRGIKIYQLNLLPRTTSTDGWTTLANQTVTAQEATRIEINDWIRDGAPITISTNAAAAIGATGSDVMRVGNAFHPLAGWWELADVMESSRNSGKWKINMTADGLHMNPTGHALGAAVIDTSVFTV